MVERKIMAEGQGFEPWMGVNPCRFSRPVHSTALPSLRLNGGAYVENTFLSSIVQVQYLQLQLDRGNGSCSDDIRETRHLIYL